MNRRKLGSQGLGVSAQDLGCMADERNITPAQLALAWVMAKGEDIVPIPGTMRRNYLEDNVVAADIELLATSRRSTARSRTSLSSARATATPI
jgi:aryl-alcohol dehydrogenase-like predicted oxidoreductase